MLAIIQFLKEYWVLIMFFVSEIGVLYIFVRSILEGIKCSLRNDILDIFDRCKEKESITHYQLESIQYSYTLYKKLKGNSFVDSIMERIKKYELVD